MTTTIKITNFRAIKNAELQLSNIVLIAGDNEGGKTSIIQACRSVMTNQVMPVEGLQKKHASLLVHSGTTGCEIACANESGEAKITFPEMAKTVSGKPLEISEFASGARSILDTELKLHSNIISDMLKSSPTKTDLIRSLGAQNITDSRIADKIWQTVDAQGWDTAHQQAKETGSKNKTLWENETGEAFGSKKAAEWMPKEWTPDLTTAKREDLEGMVKQENEWLETAISDSAVNAAEFENLKKHADKLPEIQQKISELEKALGNELQLKTDVQKILAGLPPATQPDTEDCPYCKRPLCVLNGKISVATVLTDSQLKTRKENIEQAKEQIKTLSEGITKKNAEMVALRAQHKLSADAVQKMASQKKTATSKSTVEDCRAKLKFAQDRLAAFDRRAAAAKYAAIVDSNQKIVEILAPSGLRHTVLKNKLTEFNAQLKALSDVAGWAPVELKEDMSITYRGTPYMLISTAAQFKTRVLLQIATAKIDGSTMVLIDAADVLASNENRNGLFKILLASKLEAIVAMAAASMNKVPNLKKIYGRTYWIKDGYTMEVSE